MDKKKKIILISVISVIVIIAIIVGIVFLTSKQENKTDRLVSFYNNLNGKSEYNFSMIIDDETKINYSKKDNKAYMELYYNGDISRYVIKDGNTYLLKDEDKKYYTYQNNETDLTKITGALEAIKDNEYLTGKEKINNKNYYYEEYPGVTMLSIGISDSSDIESNKTRFYFEGDKLVYIKTITDNEQELMKIETSYSVQDNLFEIPSDYQEG